MRDILKVIKRNNKVQIRKMNLKVVKEYKKCLVVILYKPNKKKVINNYS